MVRAGAGDQAAFALLMDRHLPRLHRLAGRLLGSAAEADEVGQDAFLRAWQQAPSWRSGQARFSTWLYRITFNLAHDRLRQRRDTVSLDDVELPSAGRTPEQETVAGARARRLRAAITALPERQRAALLLCHHEGFSNIDAAGVLAVSVDALESLLARARRTLRTQLGEDRPERAAAASFAATAPAASDPSVPGTPP